jgi:hypothetical protein
MAKALKVINLSDPTNGADEIIGYSEPYLVQVTIEGVSDLLFHRWNCESVEGKAAAAKNSTAKKTDDVESYVYRNAEGEICIPGEYLRMAIINAAKFRQDPRSPRKSAMDLFKAGIVCTTILASLGTAEWDYLDKRRAVVQRNGINRVRPAMSAGWTAEFEFIINVPEYIKRADFRSTLEMAGRLIGIADFKPTFGRFAVSKFE